MEIVIEIGVTAVVIAGIVVAVLYWLSRKDIAEKRAELEVQHLAAEKTRAEAATLTPEALAALLGGLPEEKLFCARLAIEALQDALGKWEES